MKRSIEDRIILWAYLLFLTTITAGILDAMFRGCA